jgi:hypothetical protein
MTGVAILIAVMLVLELFTPFWWWIAVVPFFYGALIAKSGKTALLKGLASAAFLWLAGSLYFYIAGSRLIASRMASMLGLGPSWLMVVVAGTLAAVIGGLAALAGRGLGVLARKKT